MAKVVGIGETVLDIVFKNSQPQAAVPGGSTFNAIISLGRSLARRHPEIPVVMVTQTGDDQVAGIISDFVSRNNVSSEGIQRIKGTQTTLSMAMLDERGDAHYEFFRDKSVPQFVAPQMDFAPGDMVVFGSFFAVGDGTYDQTQQLVRRARRQGASVYYDINFRKSHLSELETARKHIEDNCAMSDVVRGSSEDIFYLYGSDDSQRVYDEHISKLCRTFICTRGADRTEVYSPGVKETFPVEKIQTVSTIGAGDNFNAGFVFGILENGISRDHLTQLSAQDWKCLVPVAHRFSAHVCQSLFNYISEDFIIL